MFKINHRKIGEGEPPYIIAELSANHNGSIDRAKSSIKSAKDCGADAIKIQTYTADTMTIDCNRDEFLIKEGLWKGYKLYDLYREAHTPFEWHYELFEYAKDELLEEAAIPAFLIIIAGLIPVIIAHRTLQKK